MFGIVFHDGVIVSTAMHFKIKNQMSDIFLLILYNSDMLISNMVMKFGHHVRDLHKSNYKFIQFFQFH